MPKAKALFLATILILCGGCSARNSARTTIAALAAGADAYARTADPHIAWCDTHGGFVERAYEDENGAIRLDNGQSGVLTIQHIYIVCQDGTRIKER